MPDSFITIVYLFRSFTFLAIGLLLLAMKVPSQFKELSYYRGKISLAIAILIVGIGTTLILIYGDDILVDIFCMPVLIVASLQACLFTFLVLILFHSDYVTKKHVWKHLLPTLIFIILYTITIFFQKDVRVYTFEEYMANITNPALLLRTLFCITYVIQLGIYIILFNRQRKLYITKINDYFSDISQLRLRRGTELFYKALSIGIIVLIFSFIPSNTFDFFLTIIITVFYFVFALRYINYQYILHLIIPAVENSEASKYNTVEEGVQENTILEVRHKLEELLSADSFYLEQSITVSDIAERLNVNKRLLSRYINTVYDKNFNTWVNSMRIEHAKILIAQSGEMNFHEVAEKCGFADNAIFSKEFKRLTGELPSVYRQRIHLNR